MKKISLSFLFILFLSVSIQAQTRQDTLQTLMNQIYELQRQLSDLQKETTSIDQKTNDLATKTASDISAVSTKADGVKDLDARLDQIEKTKLDADAYVQDTAQMRALINQKASTDQLYTIDMRVDGIEDENLIQYKTEYYMKYENFNRWMRVAKKLESLNTTLVRELNMASISADIAQMNNPTSDALGFKFTDIILSVAESTLNVSALPIAEQSRFKSMIEGVAKLADNKLVQGLASFNPIVGTITSVISNAANFSYPRMFPDPNDKKNIILENVMPFSNDKLEAFTNSLVPYMVYYENMNRLNVEHEIAINTIRNKYSHLTDQMQAFKDYYNAEFQLNLADDYTMEKSIKELYQYDYRFRDGFNYHEIITTPKVISSYNKTADLQKIFDGLTTFHRELLETKVDFYTRYADQVLKAKTLPANQSNGGAANAQIDSRAKKFSDFVPETEKYFNGMIVDIQTLYDHIGKMEDLPQE